MNMIKSLRKEHNSIFLLIVVSIVYIAIYIPSINLPLLNPHWNLEIVNTMMDLMLNVFLSIFVSCVFFLINVFYPKYLERKKYGQLHLRLLTYIRSRIYVALAPRGRYFELTDEGSTRVFSERKFLYDMSEIVKRTRKIQKDGNDYMNYEISKFIMDEVHPIRFTDEMDVGNRNVDYMY